MAAIFFLVVLRIVIVPTMAFTSNIHEIMTPAEKLAVFGSEDSIPEYQVFGMSLPGSRIRREAGDEIKMTVELEGKEINLNFEPTTGYLATKYTPVWSAVSDKDSYKGIRYNPLPTAISDIGKFTMYHDVKNEGAIVVYETDSETIIEGIITSDYAIRSLPKRLMEETLKLGDYIIETPMMEKRSIISDSEVSSYLAIFRTPAPPKGAKRSVALDPKNLRREKRWRGRDRGQKRKLPEAVYPELLIVLDHNSIRDHTITQALRFMLAFWNGVDMVYSALDKPKIHLNIAGIIIAADDTATPYIAETTSITIKPDAYVILRDMGKYFFDEQVRFPIEHYDMIIGMTTIKMCQGDIDPCGIVLGYANLNSACQSTSKKVLAWKSVGSTGIFYYNWKFGGVDTAVHEAAHLFGVKHDEGRGQTANCDMEEGHVMAASAQFAHQSFKWSECSRNFFTDYFSSTEADCLDNEPLWTKPVDEVLGGRWLTIHGQCRNDGFAKACKLKKIPICLAKGCKNAESDECVANQWQPLPGSKCGTNKYCDSKNNCVAE